MQETTTRAVTYARCSTDQQEASIDQQEAAFVEYADKGGLVLADRFRDEGVSGTTSRRPGFQSLVEACRSRDDFEVVLVYDRSRWGRFTDPKDAIYWEQVIGHCGKRLIAVQGANGVDLAGDIMRLVESHEAGEYSRHLSGLVRRGAAHNAERGFWNGGPAPYGYARVLVDPATGEEKGILQAGERKAIKGLKVRLIPVESEAFIVRQIFQMRGAGYSLQWIADRLNSRIGRHWSRQEIYRILKNPVYQGDIQWRDEGGRYGETGHVVTAKSVHAAITTEDKGNG